MPWALPLPAATKSKMALTLTYWPAEQEPFTCWYVRIGQSVHQVWSVWDKAFSAVGWTSCGGPTYWAKSARYNIICPFFFFAPSSKGMVGWLVVLRIYVASLVFQPYRDLESGDNQSLKIQVARRGIERQ